MDCIDEMKFFKRNFTRLTLQQIQSFGVNLNIHVRAQEEDIVVDPEFQELEDKGDPKVDWSK